MAPNIKPFALMHLYLIIEIALSSHAGSTRPTVRDHDASGKLKSVPSYGADLTPKGENGSGLTTYTVVYAVFLKK